MIAFFDNLRPSLRLMAILGVPVALAALLLLPGHLPHTPRASAQACSSLTIVKQTVPSPDLSSTSFPFTSTDTAPPATIPPFSLLDGGSMTHTFLPADDCYNQVTETVPVGWTLTNIACTGATNSFVTIVGASGGTPAIFDPGDDTVTIDVASGENVTCTFTNTQIQAGSITICKHTDPAGGTGFTFGWSSPTIHPLPFTLDDGQCFTASGLDPADGPYTFSELLPLPAGWQLMYISCTGGANILIGSDNDYDLGDTGVTINLGPGENITCTFFNIQAATIAGQGGWGDGNCDGGTNAVDALFTLRHVVGLPANQSDPCPDTGHTFELLGGSQMSLQWADFDCDGSVDAVDALKILRQVVDLPVTKAGPCAPTPPGGELREVDWMIACDINGFGQEVNCEICFWIDGELVGCFPFGALG